jgi:Hint domain
MKPNTVGREGRDTLHSHPYSLPTPEVGFLSGTILLTQDGEMPVEFISDGDKIITRDAGFVRVTKVEQSRQLVRAISFAAGSLGDTRPDQDLILPAGQDVLIRDWRAKAMFGTERALVRADALIDGEFIRDLGLRPLDLHQLHFDTPHILFAGGLELASHTVQQELRPAA